MKYFFAILSFLFLVYLVMPGPRSIQDFSALPGSLRSTHSGDTVQVPNVEAFYSNLYRGFVTNYYFSLYRNLSMLPFPPIRLNYPPEFAFTAILDQTKSTYLEEYVYPLRDSIFVNGMEPYLQDGQPRFVGAAPFIEGGQTWQTKTTLRYYPSPMWVRIAAWLGINLGLILLWKLSRRIIHG